MSDDSVITVDELLDLLANSRRRQLLLMIAEAPESGVRLRTVAKAIYSIENDVRLVEASTQQVSNLQTTLKRSHLEPLQEAGCITMDTTDHLAPGPTHARALGVIAFAFWSTR